MSNLFELSESIKINLEEFQPCEGLEMPQVHEQPLQPLISRQIYSPEPLLRQLDRALRNEDSQRCNDIYTKLLHEFQPLIKWSVQCWDYLLTKEGCRFVPRPSSERRYHRSPYRAFLREDYQRLIHKVFRKAVQEFLREKRKELVFEYLKEGFWNQVVAEYQSLKTPEDPRQRELTSYSYLRCAPYEFLNRYHHEKVYSLLPELPSPERRMIALYFLNFYHDRAVAVEESISMEEFRERKESALHLLLELDFLVYCLLLQIERY